MSALRGTLDDYLTMRRALGYRLARTELLLGQFVAYLQAAGASTITTEHAVAWATLPGRSRAWSAMRMSAVRGFAAYLHTLDERCEVPPSDVLRPRPRSRVPYLYSDAQVRALLAVTATLSSPLRAATFRTLLGLLAVTGMRIGEAIAADRDDIDLQESLLIVRHGKFGKQRLLPLHPSALDAIGAYLQRPDRPALADCPALFVSTAGTRLLYPDVLRTFTTLVARAGLPTRPGGCSPRIHDLRHTFAVQTLSDCYRDGIDVDARLPLLSTYLGHVNPASTYWYLTGSPELLALASERLETSLGDPS
jgi:integrase/recombinase XerD